MKNLNLTLPLFLCGCSTALKTTERVVEDIVYAEGHRLVEKVVSKLWVPVGAFIVALVLLVILVAKITARKVISR